jgi:hypothetical protein
LWHRCRKEPASSSWPRQTALASSRSSEQDHSAHAG